MLPAGRIGDLYGHRRCFVVAYIIFAISSLMAGLSVYADSFIYYTICRGLQGFGSAMLVPCALAILGSIYKESFRKNLVFSFYAAGSPIGFTLGCVFSALFAQLVYWPWMFYVTTMVCCLLAVGSYFIIPPLPGETYRSGDEDESTGKSFRKDFDWLGGFTGFGGLILFNVAWNRAPAVGWGSPDVITTAVTGLALFAAFLFVERKVKNPLIPVDRISSEAALVLITTACGWASFGVMIFYLINFTLNFRGDTMLSVAAQFIPVPFTGFAASYLNSFLLRKGTPASDIMAISLVWFTVGGVLLSTMPIHQNYFVQAFWIYVLGPFGMDLNFPSATLILSRLVPPERQGIAASLVATVVYYSQSIGLGIAGTVQSNVAPAKTLEGFRSATYTGVGLSSFGFLISLWPVIAQRVKNKE
jgi:MFS family permease